MSPLNDGDSAEHVKVDVAVFQPGSSLPKHPAACRQLFYVVEGRGRVAGEDGVEHQISAGWAATWEQGEQHTSWADTLMTVVIIQRRL